jgi:hypothetical protein
VAVGEVHEADVAKLGQFVQALGGSHVASQHFFVSQSHTASAGHCQQLQKFATSYAHTNIPY